MTRRLKARIVESEETAVARQRHDKHAPAATNTFATMGNCWTRCVADVSDTQKLLRQVRDCFFPGLLARNVNAQP
jgi:hypothetical protein